jgi:hypothetical protein
LRGVVSGRPLSTTATTAAAATATLAFFQQSTTSVIAQKRDLFILVATGIKGFIFLRAD